MACLARTVLTIAIRRRCLSERRLRHLSTGLWPPGQSPETRPGRFVWSTSGAAPWSFGNARAAALFAQVSEHRKGPIGALLKPGRPAGRISRRLRPTGCFPMNRIALTLHLTKRCARLLAPGALLLAATLCSASKARADGWLFRPSTYSHDPVSGRRVNQYRPEDPAYVWLDPNYLQSGYRHIRLGFRGPGGSLDQTHIVQTWGAGEWIRPYGEWLFPFRAGATPYGPWGNPQGPWTMPFDSWYNPYGLWNPYRHSYPYPVPYGPRGHGSGSFGWGHPGPGGYGPGGHGAGGYGPGGYGPSGPGPGGHGSGGYGPGGHGYGGHGAGGPGPGGPRGHGSGGPGPSSPGGPGPGGRGGSHGPGGSGHGP